MQAHPFTEVIVITVFVLPLLPTLLTYFAVSFIDCKIENLFQIQLH